MAVNAAIEPQSGLFGSIARAVGGVITTVIPGPIDDIIIGGAIDKFFPDDQRTPTPSQPIQRSPITQGDLNPCPAGQRYRQTIFGKSVCEPDDYPSPIAQRPAETMPVPYSPQSGACGCTSLATQTCDLGAGRRGYLNKTGYFVKGGCRSKYSEPGYIAPGTQCVKRRKKNYGNVKALRGAIRRANGFDRLVKSNRKALRKLASI